MSTKKSLNICEVVPFKWYLTPPPATGRYLTTYIDRETGAVATAFDTYVGGGEWAFKIVRHVTHWAVVEPAIPDEKKE